MKVIVYSTNTCPWCVRAKEFLTENKIEFEEKDVATDAAAAEEMVQKSGQRGVPVIDMEGTVVVGFDEEKIRKTLNIK